MMGNQIEGLELVSSEHVRFLLRHLAPAAPPLSPDELVEHTTAADLATPLQAVARSFGMLRIESVVSDGDRIIVQADHDNERWPREWAFTIDADGRVGSVSAGPMVEGVEFSTTSPTLLSRRDRVELQSLFAAAYTDPDPDYLNRQFSTMNVATIARRTGKTIGFLLLGRQHITTDTLGTISMQMAGLVCVHPGEHRTGVSGGMGVRSTWRAISEFGNFQATAARLATPASLAMALKGKGQFFWPTADDLFALYDRPTPAQLELAELAAHAYGAPGYEPTTGACIGHGRPIGRPNIEPDVPEEFHQRFGGVDRQRGDSLLWLTWRVAPPDAWTAST